MADNVVANAGSGGSTFLAAEFSFSGDTVKCPGSFIGVLSGSEGAWTYTLLVGGAGAVTAGTPRMTLASDDPAVTALQIIDDWDESDRAKVNLIVGQAGIAGGAGAVGATVPRVTLASDDPAVTALQIIDDWDASDRCKVDLLTSTNAGAAVKTSDYDTGAGTDTVTMFGIALPASGGAVAGGTSTNPLRVDPTGTTTQPVSGTVSASQNGVWTVQPGNTANTTAWLVTGTGGTFPVTDNGGSLTVDHAALDLLHTADFDTGAGTDTTPAIGIALPASGGAVVGGTASNPIRVDPTGTTTQPVTVSGNATVVQSTASNLNCTEASAASIATNTSNCATSLNTMDDWDNAASDGASVSGDVAHDTADAGEPVKVGHKATTSLAGLTLVANADRTDSFAGIDGVQIVRTHCNLEDIVSGNASNTDGTSTQVIAAAGAGIKQYLTKAILTNTSSTNTYCELKSGTTVKATIPVPANSGASVSFDPPLPPNAANEAWNFDMGTAVTTAYCTLVGFKSKV